MIYAFLAICLFGMAMAQIPRRTCPDVSRMDNFDRSRFLGMWYRAKVDEMYSDVDCSSDNYIVENGILYDNAEYRMRFPSRMFTYFGIAPPDFVKNKVLLSNDHFGEKLITTDYTTYAVFYVCDAHQGLDYIQIATRDRHPTKELLGKALDILEKEVGNVTLFDVNQSNCESTTPRSN